MRPFDRRTDKIMKAIIMAGGEGSRLRPLTCDCPKPMAPLMDRPVMSYALELLRRHNVEETAVTLQYLPDRIRDYFGDGADFGVSLRYYLEKAPLGTAGSVRQAADFLDETFVVLSGDGVTDCDLTDALRFHRERRSMATLVIKHVESPLEYGVVIAESDGRVRRFVEKPGWGEVFSDTVNTGIYILEPSVLDLIPEGRAFDFGHELFPAMVQADLPVYAYTMTGYWCDIGDHSAYLRAHIDAMDGRIRLNFPGKSGCVVRMPGASVDRSAVLEGPCFIGEGAVVREGARIGAYSVLGAGALVDAHASLKRAVLWRNAQMRPRAQARGCILTENSCMMEESCAFEESVLGAGSTLGAGGTLLPGVKVWPGKRTPDGIRLDSNVVWGGTERPCFSCGRLGLRNPSHAVRIAQAYAAAMRPGSVLLGRSASSVALSYSLSVESGLMAQGVQVLDAGVSTLPQLRVMTRLLKAGGSAFVDGENLLPLDENGAELKSAYKRKIEGLLLRQDYERSFLNVAKLPVRAGRSDLIYIGRLLEDADMETLWRARPQIAVYAPNEQLLSAAECALEKAGCLVRAEWEDEMMELAPGEIGVWLTDDGEQMRLAGEDGSLTDSEDTLIRVWAMLETGMKRIVLPIGATRAADVLAERYHAEIVRVRGERAHLMQTLAFEDRRQFMMQFDGLYAALQCIGLLTKQTLSLSGWLQTMPKLSRRSRCVPVEWKDKGRVLSALLKEETEPDMTDGMSVCKDGCWAWISPSEERAECRIVTEAKDMEAANELCDFYAERIRQALSAES